MAGDWLKIEVCTPDKPEVIGIADLLGIAPAYAFGSLFLVWRWFDQHTTEGNASYVTKVTIDRLAGIEGFADVMGKVEWLILHDDGTVSLPHFDRHNGETAKQRGLTAKRVAKNKAKGNAKGNALTVSDTVTSPLPREEKRREDKETTPLSEYSDEFLQFWKEYPKKVGKDRAWQLWKKTKPVLTDVLKALSWQRNCEQWQKGFIPNPETYISQGRWKDEPLAAVKTNQPKKAWE